MTGTGRIARVASAMVEGGLSAEAMTHTLFDLPPDVALGEVVVAHSLGFAATVQAVHEGNTPAMIVASSPVVAPIGVLRSAQRVGAKLAQTYRGDPDLRGIARHNQRQAMRHPLATLGHVRRLGRIVGDELFEKLRGHNVGLTIFFGTRDVVTPEDPDMQLPDWVRVARIGGAPHDHLLLRPDSVVSMARHLLSQNSA
jgi:hypothetical protein